MVRVPRWSASGGASVPAVTLPVAVVRLQSMSVAVMYLSQYLVGVVIVVLSAASSIACVALWSGVRSCRSIFMSPCMSIVVSGACVRMLSISAVRSGMNVLTVTLGRLYMLMIVRCLSVLRFVLWMWMHMYGTPRIGGPLSYVVTCRSDL